MQQIIRGNHTGLAIKTSWKDGAIMLSMGDMQINAHRLSAKQARALACDLIQRAYQAECNTVLKQDEVRK